MNNAHQILQIQNKPLNYLNYTTFRTVHKFKLPIFFIFLHIPLGLLLYNLGFWGLLHPFIVFFLGLYYAIRKNEKLEQVALVVAYLVGAEVLWRMAGLPIFWEFGKYAAVVIMFIALVRRENWKIPKFPLFYLIFLIPACFLTLLTNSLGDARAKLSFNMSGPLLLFISCWFFSYLRINSTQLKKILIIATVPIVSIGVVTLFYTVTIDDIAFSNDSNFATSGGFGPNQVSSILGMGAFLCLTCFLLFKNNLKTTICLSVLTIFFAGQSVMTFSRGGMYNAVGAILVIILLQMRNLSQGLKRTLPVIGLALIFLFLVFPYINNFTGGKLQERFEETGSTNRGEIAESDFQLFLENPILGVGVGEAKYFREEMLEYKAASHTEFTRLISEHGIFGIFSLIFLAAGVIYIYRRQHLSLGKAFVAGVIMWSMLFMSGTGMRLAAPAFIWGLSFLTIQTSRLRKKRVLVSKEFGVLQKKFLQSDF